MTANWQKTFSSDLLSKSRAYENRCGSKVQSHSFICEYVTIGERCFIGHGVMFANDMFREGRPNPDRDSWGKIVVGNDVSIGSGATILAVTICDGVVIGAGSVVTKSITEKGVYAGIRRNCCGASTRRCACRGYTPSSPGKRSAASGN
jgi:serine acetyltransferase